MKLARLTKNEIQRLGWLVLMLLLIVAIPHAPEPQRLSAMAAPSVGLGTSCPDGTPVGDANPFLPDSRILILSGLAGLAYSGRQRQ